MVEGREAGDTHELGLAARRTWRDLVQVTLVVRVVWGRSVWVHASHAVSNGVGFWASFGSVDAAVSNKDAPLAAP